MMNRRLIRLLICSIVSLPATAPAEPVPSATLSGRFVLAFSDEFDGKKIDEDKWFYRTDNKHRSVQLKENVEIGGGMLTLRLRALETPIKGKKASGAGIISRERFVHGYYEVRAALGDDTDDDKDGKGDEGWHHAFWLMAADPAKDTTVATTQPSSRRTEIDVYESVSEKQDSFVQHIIIWKPDGKERGRLPKPPGDVFRQKGFKKSDFHTYGCLYTPEKVVFFVDGKESHSTPYPIGKFEHDPMNIWITAISANWNTDGADPSIARYDYVRFFKPAE